MEAYTMNPAIRELYVFVLTNTSNHALTSYTYDRRIKKMVEILDSVPYKDSITKSPYIVTGHQHLYKYAKKQ